MRNKSIIFIFLALAAVSCTPGEQTGRNTVPLVRNIIADRYSDTHELLRNRAANPADDICIIGSEESCLAIAEAMLDLDQRDNVDGHAVPDDLLDFAGETFCCIFDTTSHRYPQMLERHEDVKLREGAVRLALAALDTTFHITPYDIDGRGGKTRAKAIVVTNPHLVQCARFDVDTLFRATDCKIPVISALDAMFDEVFKASGNKPVNVAILCDSANVHSVSYNALFTAAMRRNGAKSANCTVIPSRTAQKGTMLDLLDDYIKSGNEQPLDFIVLDIYNADLESMKADLSTATSLMNEESMTYGRFVSEGFELIDPASAVSRKCYEVLRSQNLFTHNISKPQIVTYFSAAKPDAEDGSIILISGHYVQN